MDDDERAHGGMGGLDAGEVAKLAVYGAMLLAILRNPPEDRARLVEAVAGDRWRVRVEPFGDDAAFVVEVDLPGDGWCALSRVHRAQLGLPRLPDGGAAMLALLGRDAPGDVSGLAGP